MNSTSHRGTAFVRFSLALFVLTGCAEATTTDRPRTADGRTNDAGVNDASTLDPAKPGHAGEGGATSDASTADAGGALNETDADSGSDAPPVVGEILLEPKLPLIHNYSTASRERILSLVQRALDGLGFESASAGAPVAGDRVFVGQHYLAWIDQTGFYGKMNGLWLLNGAAGDALDFVVTDPDGRPVNFFMPGEDGEGRWPSSYKGAEHVEFPSRVVEAGDKCGVDSCNQYSLNEAPQLDNPRIEHWTACNVGAVTFDTLFEPVAVENLPSGLKLVYEGRLVKEADGDGKHDGDSCHADYLFEQDLKRHPVYLRLGYELRGDVNYIERTMQIRNPPGNPEFRGPMSLLGGFVVTGWPTPHYLKRFNRFWRPEAEQITLDWGDAHVQLQPSVWNDLTTLVPVDKDVLINWANQPVSFSASANYSAGLSATLSHVGDIDNEDVGACLCAVQGAIEMGGGRVHADVSLPIAGGASTPEGRRRLSFHNEIPAPEVSEIVLEAESALAHGVGRIDGDAWQAATGPDAANHMLYGPYATDWGGGSMQAVFHLMVDNNTAADDLVVTLEVNDATTKRIIASRELRRHEFRGALAYQRFAVNANLEGLAGHSLETRVFWHDKSFVKVDKVVVNFAAAH